MAKVQSNNAGVVGGFQRAGIIQKRRLIVCNKALPKCGKSRFGLTMPGPLAVIDLDEGMDGVIQEHQDKKEIYVASHRSRLIKIKGMEKGQDEAEEEWEAIRNEYIEALSDSQTRSVLVDTGTEMYELLRLAKFGKLSQVMPHQYGKVNKEMQSMVDMAYDSNKNVMFSHKLKRQYVNDKATGEFEIAGWKDIQFACQVVCQQWKEPSEPFPDRFHMTLMDCRIAGGVEMEGMDWSGEQVNFPMLAALILGGTEEEFQ